MLSLHWAAVCDGAPVRFSCQVQVACSESIFWVPRALPSLTFIVSYAKSMGHSVWTSQMCETGSESKCIHVQISIKNGVLVGLRFWLKRLQKWSKKCLKIGLWQFASCVNGSLNLHNVAGKLYDKGIKKNHSACKSASIAMVITLKNSWKSSLTITVTFIANKRVFYGKKFGDIILRTLLVIWIYALFLIHQNNIIHNNINAFIFYIYTYTVNSRFNGPLFNGLRI